MRKIITFLGRNPRETQYQWDGEIYPAHVFPQVLHKRLAGRYDRMLVFVTQEAKEEVLPLLEPENNPQLVPVDIPTPKTEADYWALFEGLTEEVDEGDTVIFDITHGFRSIPFLVFLAAAYLKAAKGVTLEGIYYGALEMGPPAPVIDLSPFASLLDWLAATSQFIRTGSAADLAQVLREGRPAGRSSVRNLAGQLEGLSLALMLGYPLEAMRRADEFGRALGTVSEDARVLPAPFQLLLDRLRGEYAARALAEPKSDVRGNLRIQLDLIDWYVANRQIVQAMTVAREWVISALAWRATGRLVLDPGERGRWEDAVNTVAPAGGAKKPAAPREPVDLRLSANEEQALRKLWGTLRGLRNDLAHAGMKPSPTSPEKIVRNTDKVREQISNLAALLGVRESRPGDPLSPEDAE